MIKSNISANKNNKVPLYPLMGGIVKVSILMAFTLTLLPCSSLAQEGGTVLKGGVNEAKYLGGGKNPSLNLRDLTKGKDAFGSSGTSGLPSVGESFEPPSEAFNLNAQQSGNAVANATPPGLIQNPDFTNEQAVPGLQNNQPFNMSAEQNQLQQSVQNDPDNSPEMQLAWDAWHRRVAAAIYEKFNAMAQFAFRYSHPLACYVTYTVTKEGQVINVQLPQKSPNVAFNAMVMLVINSMSGQTDILAFPPGSRRTAVNKAGMFTQNYGVQGFKYTTGDREIIPGR